MYSRIRSERTAPEANGSRGIAVYAWWIKRLARSAGYLGLGWLKGAPGVGTHLRASVLGLSLAVRRRLPGHELTQLILAPLDSVRYFELEFVSKCVSPVGHLRYLDIGSPRLVPILLLQKNRGWVADLVNPDRADLATTERLVSACDLSARARLHGSTVEESELPAGAFCLITCISVLEHIPQPAGAAREIWRALEPGGSLIVTVPCARESFDEYLDVNDYGILPSDDEGWVFGQRFYDDRSLERELFTVFGRPVRMEIFGERRAGVFMETRTAKRTGAYDLAREPYTVATDYKRYASLADVPGIGVVAMEFKKAPRVT